MLAKCFTLMLLVTGLLAMPATEVQALGEPPLSIDVKIDEKTELFARLTKVKRQKLEEALEEKMTIWSKQTFPGWQATTEQGLQNILMFEISGLGSVENQKGRTIIRTSLLSFGETLFSDLLSGQVTHNVTNILSKAISDASIDLDLATNAFKGNLSNKLNDLFDELEDEFGTRSEIKYVLNPGPALPDYWTRKIQVIWANKSGDFIKRKRKDPHFLNTAYISQPNEIISGTLYPVTKKSRSTVGAPEDFELGKFCIKRIDNSAPETASAILDCNIGKTCSLSESRPENWFENCPITHTFYELFSPFLIKSAQANETKMVWNAASLSTVIERTAEGDAPALGFTVFELKSENVSVKNANGYHMSLMSNNIPVWINGVPPESIIYPYDPSSNFYRQFALETLNFYGGRRGCDAITVKLTFLNDTKPIGKEIILERPYAALRNAALYEASVGSGKYLWTGQYIHPQMNDEYQLFIDSGSFDPNNKKDQKKALNWLHSIQAAITDLNWIIPADILGWDHTDRPGQLIGVMRPPLQMVIKNPTKAAYGITVGIKRPSGQTQMVFQLDDIKRLAKFMSKRGREDLASKKYENPNEHNRRKIKWVLKNRIVQLGGPNAYFRKSRRATYVEPLPWVCSSETDLAVAN
ncbi:MAG: hypothetical protein V7750_18245 [Sneathiella sp.]